MGYYYYYNDKYPEETSDLQILSELLGSVENEIVEFKAASNGFDFHKLGQYFSAISNEANLKSKRFGWLVRCATALLQSFRIFSRIGALQTAL